jgi:hypothetical protein
MSADDDGTADARGAVRALMDATGNFEIHARGWHHRCKSACILFVCSVRVSVCCLFILQYVRTGRRRAWSVKRRRVTPPTRAVWSLVTTACRQRSKHACMRPWPHMTSPALITPSHRHEKGSLVKKLNKEIEERKNGSVDIDRRLVLLEQESNLHTLSARQIGVNVECALVKYIWAESQRKPFFLSKLAEVFEFLEDSRLCQRANHNKRRAGFCRCQCGQQP